MDKRISESLRKLRISRNLSQSNLGKAIGISRSKISSWEIGRRDISMNDAIVVVNFFGVNLDLLMNPDQIA